MQSGGAKNGGKNSSRSYTPGRIHVSSLPNNITSQDMWVHFSRFGTVVEANVFTTSYGNTFGYVAFADPAVVDRLIIGENSPVIQIINGATATINRAWADNPGRGSQAYRGGGSGSRGGGEGSAASGSSCGVRSEISLGNYLVPQLLAILNNSGENSQGSSQCSGGGVSTTAGSRIQRPPGFLFQEHTDVWGQPPAPTSSTPLPRPRPQTPPSLPMPPPLALSEGSPLPSSPPPPPATSAPPPPPATSSTPLPELPSSTSPQPATSSTPLSLPISEWPPLESSVPPPPQILKKKSRGKR